MEAIKTILRGRSGKTSAFLIAALPLCLFAFMLPASSRAQSGHSAGNDALPLLHRAQQLIAQRNLEAARKTLEAVAEAEPHATAPLIELARVANQQKDDRGALGYLAHARALAFEALQKMLRSKVRVGAVYAVETRLVVHKSTGPARKTGATAAL